MVAGKITFNLNFTASKLYAYILPFVGCAVAISLKDSNAFIVSATVSGAVFGIKIWDKKGKNEPKEV